MLNCPACRNELTPQTIHPITFYVCDGGCGGLWIDWLDTDTVEELQSPATTSFTICKGDNTQINPSLHYHCPKCNQLVMNRRYIPVMDDVLVDECPSCGGIWVNADEVDEIREQFNREDIDARWDEITTQDVEGNATQLKRNQRFRQICRFLCGAPHAAPETPGLATNQESLPDETA